VDNLNPEFLFPELSKQKELFCAADEGFVDALMTLRLLGKLRGKNRSVLRDHKRFWN
jgi:hypothetical protein